MKVVLAHTQKPPFETRIYDKIANSLLAIHHLEIQILGADNFVTAETNTTIKLWPVFTIKRGFFNRLYNSGVFGLYLLKLKPDTIILCSPDLLWPAVVYKLIFGKRLIFDIQENFGLNFIYQSEYRKLNWINLQQLVELYFSWFFPFVDRFWLAEKVYEDQLLISNHKLKIFENKVPEKWIVPDKQKEKNKKGLCFLFSGLITEESGIQKAIDFFKAFQGQFPDARLMIAGFIPNQNLRKKIQSYKNKNRGIEVLESNDWVSSQHILEKFAQSDVLILSYKETEANKGKVPTKYFEARFMGKPVLCQRNGNFSKLVLESESGFEVDFQNPYLNNFEEIFKKIQSYESSKESKLNFVFAAEELRIDFLRFCQRFFPESGQKK
jgi:glycosyltransferase involved in cell wall biosynthesis